MSNFGPRPKPTVIKMLEGNPGKRALNKNEPLPATLPNDEPPEELSEQGRAMWNRLAPVCIRMGLLTEADVMLFSRYCECAPLWRENFNFVRKNGATFPVFEIVPALDENGKHIKNADGTIMLQKKVKEVKTFAQFHIMQSLAQELRKLEEHFGFTPSSRSRLSVDAGSLGAGRLMAGRNSLAEKFKYVGKSQQQARKIANGQSNSNAADGEFRFDEDEDE